ncbi:MAG: electron transfer flavoprotein subunit beta/FixA family protein [Deltaproteobacteria bacterium]|nr:electron transfer flavoprotein subunit beta/FixA family protein [Deltaproteobacteria bacterium]
MQVYVCIKHVPDTAANINVVAPAGFDESVKFVVNPYDEYGLEEALQIVTKAGDGEVVVVTVGKESALSTIRTALAVGATRGILVKTDAQFLDSALTSRVLQKVIQQDGTPDLVFTGKQSVDSEGMQTPYRLAAAFDMPVVTEVVGVELGEGSAMLERETGGGVREVLEVKLPCVIGATKGLNEPRYPKLPDILKAKKKEVKQVDIADLGLENTSGNSEIIELTKIPERSGATMLEGNPREASEKLVAILKAEKMI